jgi:Baseplate J-like protein
MPENCPFEVAPYATSNTIKNDVISSLNYTNQDFWSLKTRLVQFIRDRFGSAGTVLPNTFNDFVEGSVAIMLVENWAFIADMLSFKTDQMVNELFIDTVTEPDNAFRLCQLVGFKPTPPIPAKSLWIASVSNLYSQDLVVNAPLTVSIVADQGPITVELYPADSRNNPIFDQDIVIPAGSSTNSSVVGLEGRTFADVFTGTGQNLQSLTTTQDSVIYESVSVTVDGMLWERVDYFSDSQPRKEYRVEFDSDYRAYIMFGNNKAGLNPAQGSTIRVGARTGGGTVGNIVTGFAEYQSLARVVGIGSPVAVTFRNYTKGEGGYDGDTIEDIRRKLPGYLRTQDRAVTGLDYKTLADQLATPYHGQIGKSTCSLRNHGCAGNVVDIYVLARNGSDGLQRASDGLKAELSEMLEEKKMITDYVCIKDGEIVEVDVSVEVKVSRINRKFEQEIKTNVENRISQFFRLSDWDYGMPLKENDLVRYLASVKQAEGFEIFFKTETSVGDNVIPRFYQIIRPDAVEISFMYE